MPVCNTTLEDAHIHEVPVVHNLTFHQLGQLISIVGVVIAVVLSVFLIWMHALHYSRPVEQKNIIRVLFMVPIYAVVSFLSFVFYRKTVYFQVLRDCYEAIAIASFFSLLCSYIGNDLHSQKEYFRLVEPKPWIWPLSTMKKCCGGDTGIWRVPRSGLTWFNIIFVSIFQYCFVRVTMTIVSVITEHYRKYCEESLHPGFAHVWVMVIESICVSIAMYALIQFYYQLKEKIADHRPLLKIVSIKLVIFLCFWQSIVISFLTSSGVIKPTAKLAEPDIKIGISSVLLCIEMALFAIMHIFAFPYKPYKIRPDPETGVMDQHYKGGFIGIKAFFDAFNVWDMVKAIARSAAWLFVGHKKRTLDPSYHRHESRNGKLTQDDSQESLDTNDAQPLTANAEDFSGRRPHSPEAYEMDRTVR